jgi:hypothetical protein
MENITKKSSIEKYFLDRNIDKHSDNKKVRTFISYSLGIIKSVKEPKLKVIATESGISVLEVSEFINDEFGLLNYENIFDEEIKKLDDKSSIILDSFVVLRENNTKTETRKVFCSSQKRGVDGIEYLVMIGVKGNNTKVIGLKRLTKKPDLITESINLIENCLKYTKISSVKGDNHFFHEFLINFLDEKGIAFISKPTRTGSWSGKQLKECFSDIEVTGYRYHKGLYTKSLVLEHKIYGICKIVRVKPSYRSEEKKCFYIVSTNINLSVMDIVKGKKQRWKIETVFRDCSQNLGLRSCQCTKNRTIDNHVFMSFFSYNFLAEIKSVLSLTIGAIKRKIQTSLSVTTNIFDYFNKEGA